MSLRLVSPNDPSLIYYSTSGTSYSGQGAEDLRGDRPGLRAEDITPSVRRMREDVGSRRQVDRDGKVVVATEVRKALTDVVRITTDIRETFSSPVGKFLSFSVNGCVIVAFLAAIAVSSIYVYLGLTDQLPPWGYTFLIATGAFSAGVFIFAAFKAAAARLAIAKASAELDQKIQVGVKEFLAEENLERFEQTVQKCVNEIASGIVETDLKNMVDQIVKDVLAQVATTINSPHFGDVLKNKVQRGVEGARFVASRMADPSAPIPDSGVSGDQPISHAIARAVREAQKIDAQKVGIGIATTATGIVTGMVNAIQSLSAQVAAEVRTTSLTEEQVREKMTSVSSSVSETLSRVPSPNTVLGKVEGIGRSLQVAISDAIAKAEMQVASAASADERKT